VLSGPLLPAPLATALAAATTLAMNSPWWENYDRSDRYLCPGRGSLVVERNDSQASLILGEGRLTLFREVGSGPGLRYRGSDTTLILRNDELTLERGPLLRFTCTRTDQV
jgi:membrane-bound inhibitor of C-type lysozyme